MRIDYRELKIRVRLKDLLAELGWESTEGRGEQLRGPCPLTACQSGGSNKPPTSKERDFSVHIERNIYQCFRCGSSGSVLDFWSAYRGTTLHEAAKELATSNPLDFQQLQNWSGSTPKS